MKRIILIILLVVIAYGGYQYYLRSRPNNISLSPSDLSSKIIIRQTNLEDLTHVLGVATNNVFNSGKDLLNTVTDGEGEPFINKTVNDLTNQIKDLPQEQYDKVKYQFCKDVVIKYENPESTN